jgi:hypothetical protein
LVRGDQARLAILTDQSYSTSNDYN